MARDTGDQSQVLIPKTQKMVRDTSLHNTHHYEVRMKGKVDHSNKKSSAVPYISVVAIGCQLYFYLFIYIYIYKIWLDDRETLLYCVPRGIIGKCTFNLDLIPVERAFSLYWRTWEIYEFISSSCCQENNYADWAF